MLRMPHDGSRSRRKGDLRFFTRNWVQGDMTDEEADAVMRQYGRRIEDLKLPPSARELADLNPHDGYIREVKHEPASHELGLALRCGDAQRGYCDTCLRFSGVEISQEHLAILLAARRPAAFEILCGEIDRVSAGLLEYRLLLHPTGEVAIRFSGIAVTRCPAAGRHTHAR
jgi:hypothetical protein